MEVESRYFILSPKNSKAEKLLELYGETWHVEEEKITEKFDGKVGFLLRNISKCIWIKKGIDKDFNIFSEYYEMVHIDEVTPENYL